MSKRRRRLLETRASSADPLNKTENRRVSHMYGYADDDSCQKLTDATLEGEYELPRVGDSSHPLVSALRVELLKSFDYA